MNSTSEHIEILASTAWVHEQGMVPSRIVLCRLDDGPNPHGPDKFKYVVWIECDNEGFWHFSNGDYEWDIIAAWEYFERRAKQHLCALPAYAGYPVCMNDAQVAERHAPGFTESITEITKGITAIVLDRDDPDCIDKVYRAVAEAVDEAIEE